MLKQLNQLYEFMHAAGGNWRNSLFIECRACPYGKPEPCPGFLLAADSGGRPVIITADAIRQASGTPADKAECIAVIGKDGFESLYALWLTWEMGSAKECALQSIAGHMPCRKGG